MGTMHARGNGGGTLCGFTDGMVGIDGAANCPNCLTLRPDLAERLAARVGKYRQRFLDAGDARDLGIAEDAERMLRRARP